VTGVQTVLFRLLTRRTGRVTGAERQNTIDFC
jgi:hypothetical protein